MDISKYLNNETLERFALGKLSENEFKEMEQLLATSLELGEALEQTYIRLEQKNLLLKGES